MFKKTLIAAAVATLASSVAMADVSVSGYDERQILMESLSNR